MKTQSETLAETRRAAVVSLLGLAIASMLLARTAGAAELDVNSDHQQRVVAIAADTQNF